MGNQGENKGSWDTHMYRTGDGRAENVSVKEGLQFLLDELLKHKTVCVTCISVCVCVVSHRPVCTSVGPHIHLQAPALY